jgi:3-oxoacyl-[acyl-carrier-protein] synthase-3
MTPVQVGGWGTALPAATLTNADLERRLDTTDEWIVARTGIRERRIQGTDDTTTSLAVSAGRAALSRAGVAAGDVDLVVLATTTPDGACPATAALVQHQLGTAGAAFDLNAACSGFVYALVVGAATLSSARLGKVLVIGADRFTSLIDPDDRSTAILFGDGAGAVLLGATTNGSGLLASDLGGDGSGSELLQVPPGERYVRMDGQEVYRRAVRSLVGSCRRTLERAAVTAGAVDLFVAHQANLRIVEAAAARLGLPEDRIVTNVERYGNTSAASVPIALAEAADDGRLEPGDLLLLAAVGAGLSWASALLRWGP